MDNSASFGMIVKKFRIGWYARAAQKPRAARFEKTFLWSIISAGHCARKGGKLRSGVARGGAGAFRRGRRAYSGIFIIVKSLRQGVDIHEISNQPAHEAAARRHRRYRGRTVRGRRAHERRRHGPLHPRTADSLLASRSSSSVSSLRPLRASATTPRRCSASPSR